MYSVGEKVVYGSTGVCTVLGVCTPDIPGARESYILQPEYQKGTKVYAPVAGNKVPMRPLHTPQQVEALIDRMVKMEAIPESKDRQALYNAYRGAMKSTDVDELAQLLKTLYEKKKRKRQISSAETELVAMAEAILFGEMASSLRIPLNEVVDYIDRRLEVVS